MAKYSFMAELADDLVFSLNETGTSKLSRCSEQTETAFTVENLRSAGFQSIAKFFCPGRVNLIGEHMDYNGGESLPFAIDLGLHFQIFSKNSAVVGASEIWVGSSGEQVIAKGIPTALAEKLRANQQAALSHEARKIRGLSYILGAWSVLDDHLQFKALGRPLELGQQSEQQIVYALVVSGDLPAGAGLSSSAAFTIGLLWSFAKIKNVTLSNEEFALLARQVEHNFAGTPCGLMDQIAILETPPNGLLAQHFYEVNAQGFPKMESLSFGQIQELYFVGIFHSGRSHQLSDGSYKSRQEECKRAVQVLSSAWRKHPEAGVGPEAESSFAQESDSLGKLYRFLKIRAQLSHEKILAVSCDFLSNQSEKKRVRFVFEEIERVEQMKAAIHQADFRSIHWLLSEAHAGLAQNYEVSCKEIETAVHLILSLQHKTTEKLNLTPERPLFLGPRMMGGGFGGSLILLVLKSHKDEFDKLLSPTMFEYEKLTSCKARFYYVNPHMGLGAANTQGGKGA